LEAVHDEIHGYIGGQMGDPSVAGKFCVLTSVRRGLPDLFFALGFDPIFFLHHANVDRMIALWSALHPGVWVTSGPAEGGTFTIPGNAKIDNSTSMSY
jgi:tyrosinase